MTSEASYGVCLVEKMQPHLDKELLEWYGQFTVPADRTGIHWSTNWFKKVDPTEIEYYERNFGFTLPAPYREFLIKVGEGRLAKDRLGGEAFHYSNIFLGPKRIADIVSKSSEEWLVYHDFIEADDVPFFDLGNQSVLVFDRQDIASGPVRYPFDLHKIAPTFNAFLQNLSSDVTFYIDEMTPKNT